MKTDYNKISLVGIDRVANVPKKKIIISGSDLLFEDILASSDPSVKVRLTDKKSVIGRINTSYNMVLRDVKNGTPVYGTNSSFGGQASRVLTKGNQSDKLDSAKKISEALVFLDVGVGPETPVDIVRAAMMIRINMLMQGVSGVRLHTLKQYLRLLNSGIVPVVNTFGGIGASGDLTHNQRIVNVLRGLPGAKVINERGKLEESRSALSRIGIAPLSLGPKEGLALVNGDNFSTAFASIVAKKLIEYLLISQISAALTIEVLEGSDRAFHPMLARVRPHPGQEESATNYRYLLRGSKLAHQELKGHQIRDNGTKVQDGYSIRCLPQFEGVMIEKIKQSINTITINANSVSDNPLWVPEEMVVKGEKPWQWVSGGNFLAMHMVEAMDSFRKIITQLVKRNDRHLARMIDTVDNNGLPANLSGSESVDQCTFKGVQIQSGMLEVYSMILSTPVSTLFGVHEERNQDITSHAVTSGILAMQNLDLLKYSLASNLIATAQGVDLRGGPDLLSPQTRPMYEFIRSYSKEVKRNRSLSGDIEKISHVLETGEVMKMARNHVFDKI